MSEAAPPVLEVRDVSKTYAGHVEAVRGVSLRVEKGQLLVLAGASGCGKTSLLKMINRLEEPSGGSIMFGGEAVASQDAVALRRHYYADGPPKLTKRQAELYGLVAYDGYAGNTVEDLAQ